MAGFVAMVAVFAVVVLEMFFAMKGAGHVHGNEYDTLMGDIGRESMEAFGQDASSYSRLESRDASGNIHLEGLRQNDQGVDTEAAPGSSHEIERSSLAGSHQDKEEDDTDIDGLDDYADDVPTNGQMQPSSRPLHRHRPQMNGHYRSHTESDIPMQNPQRQLLQCLLLEAGILFHSIFIGMALSVATGTSFVVLLIAISFLPNLRRVCFGVKNCIAHSRSFLAKLSEALADVTGLRNDDTPWASHRPCLTQSL
jgi:ZIP Zinc transporter.